jgi:hypothetical protein
MTAVGVAVVLGLVIAAMVDMKVARVTVVVVCVLFGLVLGVTPIGDGLNAGLVSARTGARGPGRGTVMVGLSSGRDDPAVLLLPQVVRESLWAVFGLWLAADYSDCYC